MRILATLALLAIATSAGGQTRVGKDAFGDWTRDAPGLTRKITVADLPSPGTEIVKASPSIPAPRPDGALPKTLPGFMVQPFAKLEKPRLMRVAPNGDVFVSETEGGRVKILRAKAGAATAEVSVFVEGLSHPFGIAFYPAGPNPQWVYVAESNRVLRFPYASGDLKAQGPAQVIVPQISEKSTYHFTRDVIFSPDGQRMLVSVGSGSNTAEEIEKKTVEAAKAWQADHPLGAAWGLEADRADILSFDPMGGDRKTFATGIRNCVGMALNPVTHDLWCAVNERDNLGDNLAPDYVTRVKPGGFYGWPWYYLGDHEDPKYKGARPDLAGKTIVPDVLIQAHSAPLQMTFYPTAPSGPAAFPKAYAGQAFVALHGSWNRSLRTGYKVVMVKVKDGVPTGEYEDILTGFVADAAAVWGRPVGVAAARDGALLVSDDVSGWVWRVAPGKGGR